MSGETFNDWKPILNHYFQDSKHPATVVDCVEVELGLLVTVCKCDYYDCKELDEDGTARLLYTTKELVSWKNLALASRSRQALIRRNREKRNSLKRK